MTIDAFRFTHMRAFIIVYLTYTVDKCAHMRETERTLYAKRAIPQPE